MPATEPQPRKLDHRDNSADFGESPLRVNSHSELRALIDRRFRTSRAF